MSNTGSANPLAHPLEAAASLAGSMGADPRAAQRASTFMNANDGPAEIIAKVSGVVSGGKRQDDGAYFTNNEGIPWPDASRQ